MTEETAPENSGLNAQALELIESEIERSTEAKLPRIADHLRGLAELIRSGRLAVTKLDDTGMTFMPTGKGDLNGLEDLVPGKRPARGQRLIIEEKRGD